MTQIQVPFDVSEGLEEAFRRALREYARNERRTRMKKIAKNVLAGVGVVSIVAAAGVAGLVYVSWGKGD